MHDILLFKGINLIIWTRFQPKHDNYQWPVQGYFDACDSYFLYKLEDFPFTSHGKNKTIVLKSQFLFPLSFNFMCFPLHMSSSEQKQRTSGLDPYPVRCLLHVLRLCIIKSRQNPHTSSSDALEDMDLIVALIGSVMYQMLRVSKVRSNNFPIILPCIPCS